MKSSFPEPRILRVDENGVLHFNNKQWKWLLNVVGSQAKTLSAQRRVIKKLITTALKLMLKKLNK